MQSELYFFLATSVERDKVAAVIVHTVSSCIWKTVKFSIIHHTKECVRHVFDGRALSLVVDWERDRKIYMHRQRQSSFLFIVSDLRELAFFFFLTHFEPEFLRVFKVPLAPKSSHFFITANLFPSFFLQAYGCISPLLHFFLGFSFSRK